VVAAGCWGALTIRHNAAWWEGWTGNFHPLSLLLICVTCCDIVEIVFCRQFVFVIVEKET
jgi:hypothetical protein